MDLVESPEGVATLRLDDMLGLAAARPLADALASLRGSDLYVSAKQVKHLGGQCAQVLAASLVAWRADGHQMQIIDGTPEFSECANILGLHSVLLNEEMSQ